MDNRNTTVSLLPRYALLVLAFGVLGACAGSGLTSGNPDEISPQQVQEARPVSNAYALVQRLRPNWLEKRGTSSIRNPSDIVIYVDGSRRGGPDSLRQISVANVQSMRYMNPNQATLRYGSGHDHGVIQVHLKSE